MIDGKQTAHSHGSALISWYIDAKTVPFIYRVLSVALKSLRRKIGYLVRCYNKRIVLHLHLPSTQCHIKLYRSSSIHLLLFSFVDIIVTNLHSKRIERESVKGCKRRMKPEIEIIYKFTSACIQLEEDTFDVCI